MSQSHNKMWHGKWIRDVPSHPEADENRKIRAIDGDIVCNDRQTDRQTTTIRLVDIYRSSSIDCACCVRRAGGLFHLILLFVARLAINWVLRWAHYSIGANWRIASAATMWRRCCNAKRVNWSANIVDNSTWTTTLNSLVMNLRTNISRMLSKALLPDIKVSALSRCSSNRIWTIMCKRQCSTSKWICHCICSQSFRLRPNILVRGAGPTRTVCCRICCRRPIELFRFVKSTTWNSVYSAVWIFPWVRLTTTDRTNWCHFHLDFISIVSDHTICTVWTRADYIGILFGASTDGVSPIARHVQCTPSIHLHWTPHHLQEVNPHANTL